MLEKLNGREMKVFFILSIVAPIGLLTAFRVTGLIPGSSVSEYPEYLRVDAVNWVQERPASYVLFNDTVTNRYVDRDLTSEFRLVVDRYNDYNFYLSRPSLSVILSGSASVPDGWVESSRVVFSEHGSTQVGIFANFNSASEIEVKNLTVIDLADGVYNDNENKLANDTKAYVTFSAVNRPNRVYFWLYADWIIQTPMNQSHSLDAVLEFTYRSGQIYDTVALPIRLDFVGDNNNTFETAIEINAGNHTRFYIGGSDVRDFYKIYCLAGQRIKVAADSSPWLSFGGVPDFTLYIYDPQRNPIAAADQHPYYVQNIELTTNSTGYWYIEVRNDSSAGFYSLVISQ